MIADTNMDNFCVLILNPTVPKMKYLSLEVYCCTVKKSGFPSESEFFKFLNLHYSAYIDAMSLITAGHIDQFFTFSSNLQTQKPKKFNTLKEAVSFYKNQVEHIYAYDTKSEKYTWMKVEDR